MKEMKHQTQSLKFMAPKKSVFDMSDPGTGKTYVEIKDFAKQHKKDGKAMLVVCPKSLMRAAWENDVKKFAPHLTVSCAYAKNRAEALGAKADVYVLNVDGVKELLKYKPAFWKKFGRIVVDECFPAGTLVDTPSGPTPIEVLKVGDLIYTSSGTLPISNTFSKESDKLCQIEFDNGDTIECTENHPFATTSGWVEARATGGLSVVRLDIHKLNQSRSTLLQSNLQQKSNVVEQNTRTTDSDFKQNSRKAQGSTNVEQGDSLSTGNKSKIKRIPQSIWSQAKSAWWKWTNSTLRSNDARNATKVLGMESCDPNKGISPKQLSKLLQAGFCAAIQKMGTGSRRTFAHIAQKLGCEERFISGVSRVVRVSSVERSSPRMVFNLQVDGPHTYSVGGYLVHNCTAFKHHTSQRSKALAKLIKNFEWRRLMSGTPTSNGVCDLWHQMFLLDDGKRVGKSFFAFRSACCTPEQVGPSTAHLNWVDKPGIELQIGALISDIVIRHKFEDCVDIPENHKYAVPIALTTKHLDVYNELRDSSLAVLRETTITAVNAAVLAQKLLQAASGAVYNDDGGYSYLANDRYDLALDLVEARDHTVVFYQWEHQLNELVKEARSRKVAYTTWNPDHPIIAEDFQAGKYKVLFAHPASAGHGLTLTKGTATIWVSPTYNLEHYLQGLKRIHRIGQSKKTETIVIIAEGTIDEKVYKALEAKNVNMAALLAELT